MDTKKAFKHLCVVTLAASITACGTLTGIPSHGGGKRFAIEQELVSGTARAAAKGFDVSKLKGRRAAIYLTSIGDVGTGNILGGRWSLSALLRGEALHSPIVEQRAKFSILDTIANTNSGSSTSTTSATSSSTGSRNTTSGIDNAATTAGGTTSVTAADNASSGSSSTSNRTNTSSTSSTNSNASTNAQIVTAQPTFSQTQTSDDGYNMEFVAGYNGIGGYSNSQVVVARDTQFLSAIIQKYLVLKGVIIVPPELAEVDIYITVDVFGTIRSRKDWFVSNHESLIAKTAMEFAAIDRRTGEVIVPPHVSSYEAEYREDFAFWVGPYETSKHIKKSDGLLADFTDILSN